MEHIGKYQITGELGGGFGKVYKALDPTVGRVVAIKVLNVQDDPALIMRFEAEADIGKPPAQEHRDRPRVWRAYH